MQHYGVFVVSATGARALSERTFHCVRQELPPAATSFRRMKTLLNNDGQAMLLLAGVFCFLFAYFFQGGGWNQNSHFDTIRSVVERHALDITPFAKNTGDVARHDGKVYSNKGPGLAFVAAPIYFVLDRAERVLARNADPVSKATFNAHVLSFFTSGLPGVVLVLVLYLHFRRSSGTIRESLLLAGGFGAGSLVFPYTGVMMSHVFTACVLFTSWYILSRARSQPGLLVLAGLLTGMAVFTDLLATPVALLLFLYAVRAHPPRASLQFSTGAGAVALAFLTYNTLCFGDPFTTNQTLKSPEYQTEGLLLGMLQVPDVRRLYWLTVHPFRGLLYCCPVFLVPLLSWPKHWRSRALSWEQVLPLTVIASFALFMLSFNGWAGGFCVGPRYLIPMLPFLFSLALPGFRRCTVPSMLLMALSSVFMFSVTAVQLIVRAPNGGTAAQSDPVGDSLYGLMVGKTSASTQGMLDYLPTSSSKSVWASYNLGELVGLRGIASVLPAALVLVAFAAVSLTLPERPPRAARRFRFRRRIARRARQLSEERCSDVVRTSNTF